MYLTGHSFTLFDFESLSFTAEGLNPACEEAIQIGYGTSVVLAYNNAQKGIPLKYGKSPFDLCDFKLNKTSKSKNTNQKTSTQMQSLTSIHVLYHVIPIVRLWALLPDRK